MSAADERFRRALERVPALIAEKCNPTPVDTFAPLGYTPNERQAELHAVKPYADGGPWDLLFGGAMGGGKTVGLVHDSIQRAIDYPGIEIWYVRNLYRDLEREVISKLQVLRYAAAIGGKWNGADYALRFPNGSVIRYLHAPSKSVAAGIRGECQYLIIDERTFVDPEAVDLLSLRIRSGNPNVPVIGIRSGTNPGGVGHSRLKKDFIDPAPLGREELPITDDQGNKIGYRFFIPSLAKDNPHIDAQYEMRFGMQDASWRAAYRDGDWGYFEGMRFAHFRPAMHIVEPFDISLAEKRGVGVDLGSLSPFAAVWGALVGDQLVVYREVYEAGLTSTEQAQLILASEADDERQPGVRDIPVWVDPEGWIRSRENPLVKPMDGAPPADSKAWYYHRAGLAPKPADNRRIEGWARLDELLAPYANGEPRLVIFSTCPNVIRSFAGAPRSTKRPLDVDQAYKDAHAADALRYLAMGFGGRLTGDARPPQRRRHSGDRVGALTGGVGRMGF